MLRLIACLCCVLATLTHAPVCAADGAEPPKRVSLKPEELYEKYSGAVVSIQIQAGEKRSRGTGFFWEGGEVVTNFHVIAEADAIQVEMAGGRKVGVEGVLWADRERDLAVISLDGDHLDANSKPTHPVANVPSFQPPPKIGSTIYVIGDPVGLKRTISNGLISGVRAHNSLHTVYQITAPISPGNSGSPVFNEYGEVVGVVTSTLTNAQNVNFCVPSSYISPPGHFELMPLDEWAEYSKGGVGPRAEEMAVPEAVKSLLANAEFRALSLRGVRSASVETLGLKPEISDHVNRTELNDLAVGRLRSKLDGFRIIGESAMPDPAGKPLEKTDCVLFIELTPLSIVGGRAIVVSLTAYRPFTPLVMKEGGGATPLDGGTSPAPVWSRFLLITSEINDLDTRIKDALRPLLDSFAKDLVLGNPAAGEK